MADGLAGDRPFGAIREIPANTAFTSDDAGLLPPHNDKRMAIALRTLALLKRVGVRAELDRIVYTNMRTEMPIKGEWTIAPRADDEGYLRLGGHYKIDNGWSFADYDRVRRLLAEWIMRLNG